VLVAVENGAELAGELRPELVLGTGGFHGRNDAEAPCTRRYHIITSLRGASICRASSRGSPGRQVVTVLSSIDAKLALASVGEWFVTLLSQHLRRRRVDVAPALGTGHHSPELHNWRGRFEEANMLSRIRLLCILCLASSGVARAASTWNSTIAAVGRRSPSM
jgi:hypothetical protein